MIFCERWYYIQVSYKGDHELLGYQPCEEGEGRTLGTKLSIGVARGAVNATEKNGA